MIDDPEQPEWFNKIMNTQANQDLASSSTPARGSETPRWGLGDAADRKMDVIEAVLRHYDEATEYSIAQPGNAEAGEIIREGVENFMGASLGVAPAQCFMIGVKYCLRALENWRKYGPEGESQNGELSDCAGENV